MAYRKHDILTLDFETYYTNPTKGYTLTRMSTTLYVCDPRFKIHGVAVKLNDEPTKYYRESEMDMFQSEIIEGLDWSNIALLCQHTHFDGFILHRHFNTHATYYLDSLSMARALLKTKMKKLDLDSLAKYFNIGGKLEGLEDTKNKLNLTEDEAQRLGDYCINDVDITYEVFQKLLPDFTDSEMDLIDMTIKMYTQPNLKLDGARIQAELDKILAEKQKMFEEIEEYFPPEFEDLDALTVLRSNDKLAETLRYNGIEPPIKKSPTTGDDAYAFAKSDLEFQKFETDVNPVKQLFFKARTTSKSDTALNKMKMFKQFYDYGVCPVYLNYGSAQTLRWSGGDKINLQNMPRGGEARKSVLAPDGHVLLVSDLSQIELRVSAWFAQQNDVLDIFRNNGDVYKDMASKIYNKPVEDITKDERAVGKVACLGLGYGCGINKFDYILKSGAMGPKMVLPISEVSKIHSVYRTANNRIVECWNVCNILLGHIATNKEMAHLKPKYYKGLTFTKGMIEMPGDHLPLIYGRLGKDENDCTYMGANGMVKRMYGALLFENIVQALARNVIAEQMLEVGKKYKVALSVHDEMIVIVPENKTDEATKFVENIMRTPPTWAPDIPIDCESGWAREYSK